MFHPVPKLFSCPEPWGPTTLHYRDLHVNEQPPIQEEVRGRILTRSFTNWTDCKSTMALLPSYCPGTSSLPHCSLLQPSNRDVGHCCLPPAGSPDTNSQAPGQAPPLPVLSSLPAHAGFFSSLSFLAPVAATVSQDLDALSQAPSFFMVSALCTETGPSCGAVKLR